MNKSIFTLLTVVAAMVMVTACAPQKGAKSENASQAIEQAQAKGTKEAKVDYLVQQARSFIDNDQYQEAQKVANHILSKIDQNSKKAQELLADATEAIKNQAQEAADDVKKAADEMKKNLPGMGN